MDSIDSWGRETRVWDRLEAWANTVVANRWECLDARCLDGRGLGETKTRSMIKSRSSSFDGVELSALLTETTNLAFHLVHT